MYISKPLDCFKTKRYNVNEVIYMEQFMNYDFDIKKILLVWHAKDSSEGSVTHQNRQNHGMALHRGGLKEYVFDDRKF